MAEISREQAINIIEIERFCLERDCEECGGCMCEHYSEEEYERDEVFAL